MLIYQCLNKINGKSYIGKTINTLKRRKREHYKPCEWKRQLNSIFYKALRKYKKSDFEWHIIERCKNIDELNNKEIYYIKKFKSLIKENGYNMTLGGTGGDTLSNHPRSKEISKKKSISMKGKNVGNLNAAKRPEVRKKINETVTKIHQGGKNSSSNKTWKITFPDGKTQITTWFKNWCKENNWCYQVAVQYRLKRKKYRNCIIEQL